MLSQLTRTSITRIALLLRPALALVLLLTACTGTRRASQPPASEPQSAAATTAAATPRGVDVSAMDRSASPGDDFYAFANGTWLRTAEIPADRPSTGSFLQVLEEVEKRNRAVVEEAAKANAPDGSVQQKVGDLFATFVDEEAIEAKGLTPVRPELARIAALTDARALAAELGGLVRADVDIINCTDLTTTRPLGLWVEQDINVPTRNTAYFVQGGLGLPDRSYYLDEDPRLADIRAK